MKKYAKIIDEITKACSVGIGTNESYYKSIGMDLMNVEESYDGHWYLEGYAPHKPIELMKEDVRSIRNGYLADTDKYMLIDFPINEETKQKYIEYRQYLRDYTNHFNWWLENPKTFEEWSA